ncbi:uncharacterized protein UHO2_05232 [Ustilago hordei]|uniref:uncharacterized protein n=1 Tax=Ustilago hordei TaxID=120017 RepID=UPI001A55E1E0|nr:uncharacterized protein UHO2_05232 [Ustilago hordei]SYW80673.1 uncharacterized protein UHO2_05232 [Ustilago hordei]
MCMVTTQGNVLTQVNQKANFCTSVRNADSPSMKVEGIWASEMGVYMCFGDTAPLLLLRITPIVLLSFHVVDLMVTRLSCSSSMRSPLRPSPAPCGHLFNMHETVSPCGPDAQEDLEAYEEWRRNRQIGPNKGPKAKSIKIGSREVLQQILLKLISLKPARGHQYHEWVARTSGSATNEAGDLLGSTRHGADEQHCRMDRRDRKDEEEEEQC